MEHDRVIGRLIRALARRAPQVSVAGLFAAALLAAAAQRTSHTKQENPERRAEPPEPVRQVVFLALGPKWIKGAAHAQQPTDRSSDHKLLEGHVRYVKGLFEAGTLLLGGPFLDDSEGASSSAVAGAMYVLAAETAEQARSIATGDPLVQAGMLQVVEVRRWRIALSRCK